MALWAQELSQAGAEKQTTAEDSGQSQMPGEGNEDFEKLSVVVARIRARQRRLVISRAAVAAKGGCASAWL